MKVANRLYKCAECGNEVVLTTNHQVDCYPLCKGKCRQILNPHMANEVVLRRQTAHRFIKDVESEETRVVFRKFSNGEVIALFPDLPGTNEVGTCQSYVHLGQHGAASLGVVRVTTPAIPEEYGPLTVELVRVGYNLNIVRRVPSNSFKLRVAALKERTT